MDEGIKEFLLDLAEVLDAHGAGISFSTKGQDALRVSVGSNSFKTSLALSAESVGYLIHAYEKNEL